MSPKWRPEGRKTLEKKWIQHQLPVGHTCDWILRRDRKKYLGKKPPNFPNLTKTTKPQLQEAQQTPSTRSMKKTMRHIIIKSWKQWWGEILKAARGRPSVYRGPKQTNKKQQKKAANLLSEIIPARRQETMWDKRHLFLFFFWSF